MESDPDIISYIKEKAALVDKKLHEYLSDSTSPQYLKNILKRTAYTYDEEAIERSIMEPARHILGGGGKRLRPVLTLAVLEAFGKDSNNYIEFSTIPEIVHNATLIHDDIEDGSSERRGLPVVHVKYGLDIALNLGDFMFFFPMNAITTSTKIDDTVKVRLLKMYAIQMQRLGIGQGVDLAWHNQLVDISTRDVNHYLQTAFDKTGALTGMAAQIGAILAGADDPAVNIMGEFGASIGVAFQIKDDLLNVAKSGVSDNKGGIGEDITEGKVTLMVLYALQNAPVGDRMRLMSILKEHTSDAPKIKEAIEIMERAGSMRYAEWFASKLIAESWAKASRALPDTPATARLKSIADFVINRTV